jgi:hypothetical protein
VRFFDNDDKEDLTVSRHRRPRSSPHRGGRTADRRCDRSELEDGMTARFEIEVATTPQKVVVIPPRARCWMWAKPNGAGTPLIAPRTRPARRASTDLL